jgi:hypothetical protein
MLRFVRLAMVGAVLCLTCCAVVDSSIESRVGTITNGYDNAFNDELLRNVVRAADSQPLRFFSHSKISPSQMSDLKIGLPAVTFGPGQTAAQKQFPFAPNSTDNSASLSYELDPIETRDFHNSLLTPVSVGILGLLLQNFPKEQVFLALFDGIRYQEGNGAEIEFPNDPPLYPAAGCPPYTHYETFDPARPSGAREVTYYEPNGSIPNTSACRYERFVYWTELAIAFGLTADFASVPNPKYVAGDKSGSQAATILKGELCFDIAQAREDLQPQVTTKVVVQCESKSASPPAKKPQAAADAGDRIVQYPITCYPFRKGNADVCIRLGFRMRSLMGVFKYLGKIMVASTQGNNLVTLYHAASRSNGDSALFTVRRRGSSGSCFAAARSDRGEICVPLDGADNTRRMFALLSELVSLNQTATDVPASLTVRIGQ